MRFKRMGWLHRPDDAAAVLFTAACVAFCANVFVVVDRSAHSVSDTLYGVFPFWVPTFLLHEWLASRTAR